jgi:hypothetical protein
MMLCTAMTGFLDPMESVRLIFYDCLLLFETLGWTEGGWQALVRGFPVSTKNSEQIAPAPQEWKGIPEQTWIEAFKHLEGGGSASELVSKLHLAVDDADRVAKKYLELKSMDAKVGKPGTAVETKDEDIRMLEHDVQVAELERRKAELREPMELSKTVNGLVSTISVQGRWKREHCVHMKDLFCLQWFWGEKPDVVYRVGDPLLKEGKWYIAPSPERCATCPDYEKQGEVTVSFLQAEIEKIQDTLGSTLMVRRSFVCSNCGTKGLVAVTLKCTRCNHEDLWGWFPKSQK